MTGSVRPLTRTALFAALVYVLSWSTAFLPNVNLAFFLAFCAGYVWGAVPGLLVGGIGMWLWTSFNPYGPAALPVTVAQVVGMAGCGLIGRLFRPLEARCGSGLSRRLLFAVGALACTIVFYLPVTLADAWISGVFWLRFAQGAAWIAVSAGANLLIFPLLFGVARHLYDRERQWSTR